MKTIALLMAITLGLSGCNAQEKGDEARALKNAEDQINKESTFKPKGNWSVTKEYDENGNVIRYDSIYSYSYSNVNGDTAVIKDVDSVIQSFQKYFEERIPGHWDRSFMNPYWQDSLLFDDFFNKDFFYDRWKEDFFDMESKFLHMDSLRTKYFQDFYPGIFEKQKRQEKEHLQDG